MIIGEIEESDLEKCRRISKIYEELFLLELYKARRRKK
jgi:hypothetical protein